MYKCHHTKCPKGRLEEGRLKENALEKGLLEDVRIATEVLRMREVHRKVHLLHLLQVPKILGAPLCCPGQSRSQSRSQVAGGKWS